MLAITPMLVNSVVRVFGWLAMLGDRGLVNAVLMGLGLTGEPMRLVSTGSASPSGSPRA